MTLRTPASLRCTFSGQKDLRLDDTTPLKSNFKNQRVNFSSLEYACNFGFFEPGEPNEETKRTRKKPQYVSFNPFSPDSTKSKTDQFSKSTNWVKLKKKRTAPQ